MAIGSYCWSSDTISQCGDAGDPKDATNIPSFPGGEGRVHLSFVPSAVRLELDGHQLPAQPSRVISFRTDHTGLLIVTASRGTDDVTYLIRLARAS